MSRTINIKVLLALATLVVSTTNHVCLAESGSGHDNNYQNGNHQGGSYYRGNNEGTSQHGSLGHLSHAQTGHHSSVGSYHAGSQHGSSHYGASQAYGDHHQARSHHGGGQRHVNYHGGGGGGVQTGHRVHGQPGCYCGDDTQRTNHVGGNYQAAAYSTDHHSGVVHHGSSYHSGAGSYMNTHDQHNQVGHSVERPHQSVNARL